MSANGNGGWATFKKALIAIATVLGATLITQEFINTNRITRVEAELESLRTSLTTNRSENREEHGEIKGMIRDTQALLLKGREAK